MEHETGGHTRVDAVVVVSAPREVQRSRVLSRPGMTPEKLDHILARQTSDVDKRAGFATQMFVQGVAAAVNPTLTLSVAASGITAAIALKNATSGSAPTGMFVRRSDQNGLNGASWP